MRLTVVLKLVVARLQRDVVSPQRDVVGPQAPIAKKKAQQRQKARLLNQAKKNDTRELLFVKVAVRHCHRFLKLIASRERILRFLFIK